MANTKIVCTIGPASRSPEKLKELMQAGMDVARLNFSHGSHSEYEEVIKLIRKLSREMNRPAGILQDLGGPKIRIGKIESGTIHLKPGTSFILTNRKVPGDKKEVFISYKDLPNEVEIGDTLLLSDGALELEVEDKNEQDIKCRVIVGGPLSSYKGINLPTRSIKTPSLTEKDKRDLEFGIEQGVDFLALSFVRNKADVTAAKQFMQKRNIQIPIIAKIEKHEALTNIDEIIQEVYGIMVARGDLGVDIPLEEVPLVQKELIQKSNCAGKPVITATQMLRSMTDNPRPTRAEVTDVANAILDGTDAIMLSEETAIGKYPAEAVAMMSRIAHDVESKSSSLISKYKLELTGEKSIPDAVSWAAYTLAESIKASAIITFTQSGQTARLVARFRPDHLILAPTQLEKTYQSLSLVWGVIPILFKAGRDTDETIQNTIQAALNSGLVKKGEKVVITAGIPIGIPGTTNMVKAEIV